MALLTVSEAKVPSEHFMLFPLPPLHCVALRCAHLGVLHVAALARYSRDSGLRRLKSQAAGTCQRP